MCEKYVKILLFLLIQYGVHGLCENLYDVEYQFSQETDKTQAMKLTKTLNLHNCTGKPHVFTNIPGIRCLSKNCDRVEEVSHFWSYSLLIIEIALEWNDSLISWHVS